jgi:nucleoid-associated protein YgaU
MYDVYLDALLLPITPSAITLKIKNKNKTVELINEGDINILRTAGLTEVSFQMIIPQVQYPFAKYRSGFKGAKFYLDAIESLKVARDSNGNLKPFQFIVSRSTPNQSMLFSTNLTVAIEDYTIKENADNGLDLVVDITLKQFRPYATKVVNITETNGQQQIEVQPVRQEGSHPKASNYTVVAGNSLWEIAKLFLGDGERYNEIYELNKELIDSRNKGTGLSKYTIYAGQVFDMPSK